MRSSGRLRRTLAITACGGLVSALAWIPAGPASANVANVFFAAADGTSQYTGSGGFACTLTAGVDNPVSSQATFSSGKRTRSVNLNQTFTSSANGSDVTNVAGHYKGSLSVSKHHGDLSGFKMTGDGHATIHRALGNATQCQTSAFLAVESQTEFTESKKGWLYLTRQTGKSAETVFDAENEATGLPLLFEVYFGNASKATARGFVTPGTYAVPEWAVVLVAGQGGGVLKSAGGGTVQRSSLSSQLSGKFYGLGAAYGGAHGVARAFVRFPSSVSCSHRSAKLRWTGRAGRVAGGSFFVNGHKLAAVSNPKAGHSVVLRHLGKTADNKITVKLSLTGGGKASATRAYVPCKH